MCSCVCMLGCDGLQVKAREEKCRQCAAAALGERSGRERECLLLIRERERESRAWERMERDERGQRDEIFVKWMCDNSIYVFELRYIMIE